MWAPVVKSLGDSSSALLAEPCFFPGAHRFPGLGERNGVLPTFPLIWACREGGVYTPASFYPCPPPRAGHPVQHALRATQASLKERPHLKNRSVRTQPGLGHALPVQCLQTLRVFNFRARIYAGFRIAPSGTTPVCRYRHISINSLRAKATIPTRRDRRLPGPYRSWNHKLNRLCGCQRNHDQAISTANVRTRRLPALLMPCSRSRLSPLW